MQLAGTATAPRGFVQFCERQIADCGATASELEEMRQQSARNDSSTAVAAISFDWSAAFAEQRRRREVAAAAAAAPQVRPVSLSYDWGAAFARTATRPELVPSHTRSLVATAGIPLNARTWSQLTRTNDTVNRAIAQRSDLELYGVPEMWATPLEAGLRAGDCEDYVLEKRRALISAGLPASALSIAVVTTDRRETHAVLLVSTDKGEYVLDSLSAWVLPWAKTGYQWRERQVSGSASNWAFAAEPTAVAAPPPGLLLSSLR